MPLKHDADAIKAYIQGLKSVDWLEARCRWWPNFLFRSDHVENAADILNCGELLSRAAAENGNLIKKDSSSPSHINQLASKDRRWVRLYFRPRTPTQYSNEGIRPTNKIKYGAHMPVPIYLLFSSRLLMEQGVGFSRGRLTPESKTGTSAAYLEEMNFRDIYHDSSVGRLGMSNRRSKVLNARHSEVLVQDRLPLDYLKYIVCRSGPERETLLNLLKPEVRDRWERKVVEDDGRRGLFYRRGTFVTDVYLSDRESRFTFHSPPDPDWRKPFHLEITWTGETQNYHHSKESFMVPDTSLKLTFSYSGTHPTYDVVLKLNGDLAYIGKFKPPFFDIF